MSAVSQFITVLSLFLVVAIVAVLVSKNAKTSEVTSSFFGGFSKAIGAAVSPVTGSGLPGLNGF